jgi:hypothetical protein
MKTPTDVLCNDVKEIVPTGGGESVTRQPWARSLQVQVSNYWFLECKQTNRHAPPLEQLMSRSNLLTNTDFSSSRQIGIIHMCSKLQLLA